MIESIISTILSLLFARCGIHANFWTPQNMPEDIVTNASAIMRQEESEQRHSVKLGESIELFPAPEIDSSLSPNIDAEASIVLDEKTDLVIYEHNMDQPLPIASITKLMVAMVVLDNTEDLDAIYTVNNPKSIGSNMKLEDGEKITKRKLLMGSLIASANDASGQLAIATAGSKEAFVEKMNEKAQELNLKNTVFYNITGLDREEDPSITSENISTVFELAQLVDHSLQYETIWDIVDIEELTVASQNKETIHELRTTNLLLGNVWGLKGGKTGFTDRAGQSLVTVTTRGENTIITAMLDSPNRFAETEHLIDWTYRNTAWNRCTEEDICGTLK